MHQQSNPLQKNKLPANDGSWILVVTPQPRLGDIISDSLKDSMLVEHTSKASKAVSVMRMHPECKYAILDMEMGELNILELGFQLRKMNPNIGLILISSDDPPTDFDDLLPWKFLHKPFVLEDIRSALGITKSDNLSSSLVNPDFEGKSRSHVRWSDNVGLATHYLERMIEKSFAQEVILIHNQKIWSCAGQLSDESVQELKSKITRSFESGEQSDLTRYITLETSQTEYALYASILAIGLILAMVFDPDIPFGVVRRQTRELADTLLLLDDGEAQNDSLPEDLSILKKEAVARVMELQEKLVDNENHRKTIPDVIDTPISSDPGDNQEVIPSTSTEKLPVDLPKPEGPFILDLNDPSDRDFFRDLEVAAGKSDWVKKTVEDDLVDTRPVRAKISTPPASETLGELIEKSYPEHDHQISSLNEFIPDALYYLTYTFLLIPRFRTHMLKTGEMNSVKEYIKNLHLSCGWRLEMLDMQPGYLRWVSSFPPNIAPSSHLEIIRKGTSKQLFDEFPVYKKENLSGDYWAPGYIIIEGKNSISSELVLDYIEKNRKKHGIDVD